MKKIFCVAMLLTFLISANCFAMTFSQPVEVGSIGRYPRSPFDGVDVEGASEIQATPAEGKDRYKKGWARWGEGKNSIYCHFEGYDFSFGDRNISNTVKAGECYVYIKKINNDENKVMYLINTAFSSGSFHNVGYAVVGQMDDGKWVKYFDVSGSLNINLEDNAMEPHPSKFTCKGDTIIIEFETNKYGTKVYEMRYKWDDKAQWFGVEKVMY